ncbi:EAL domain-containing protein [Klebsiella pneumoniae]|uniref:EAL domain-containing protein n=1 Tax=Klebsiella pneumoniae TaxID=573 RepID=UPI002731E2CA|nr:EAL domain-containing protein [Klebsiella pneumoniae]MDP1182882.1 EAL domain-containing protein [Klebsiella pneumoniae]
MTENLQRVGFRIFLDDCFSLSSVVLPVRMPIFNGYKLDMSVICDLQNNPKISLLIKSLVYYCRLVQSHCIAEGIDSLESFNRFKELGVKFFQGDLFSSPVAQEDLDDVYRRFYHNVNS